MALKAEIEAVVGSMVGSGSGIPPLFIFGTEDELNVKVDDLELSSVIITPGPTEINKPIETLQLHPVVFMYSLQGVGNSFTNSMAINNSFDIFLFFGYKIELGTTTDQCEVLDVQIIDLINEFLIRLSKLKNTQNGKVFEINVNDQSKSRPIFNKDDVNLYGRVLTMNLKTFYNKKLCF